MKVRYEQTKGNRIKKGAIKISVGDRVVKMNNFFGLRLATYGTDLCWCDELDKWCNTIESLGFSTSTHNTNIKNLKQAIRHLKKQKQLRKGTEFVLESNFRNHNIHIII